MGIVLVIVGAALCIPLLLLGGTPLVLVMSVPRAGKSSPFGGVGAALCLLVAMALIPLVSMPNVPKGDTVFFAILWCAGWIAVTPGCVISFGILWARVAHSDPPVRLLGLLALAMVPWPFGLLLLLVPWQAVNMAGMLIAFGLSALTAPAGVALAARSARNRVKAASALAPQVSGSSPS